METVCQPSYPLNSENPSPFGPPRGYLAWPVFGAKTALPTKTASTETASPPPTITTAGILLLFIATLLVVNWLRAIARICLRDGDAECFRKGDAAENTSSRCALVR